MHPAEHRLLALSRCRNVAARWFGYAAMTLLTACGHAHPGQIKQPDHKVDFVYEMEGERHYLSELRGRPLVLVLMRTSELPSQVYMIEVKEAFRRAAGKTRFLVLTIAATELPFLQLYRESQELPFAVGVAGQNVATGKSSLGLIPAVPATYIIDASGRVVDMASGVIKMDKIVHALQRLPSR